ncbi:protein HAPLESS 2 [Hordeum vulgare subsp. vulgare]|uniref:Generative cell specific-1/HAP2 domain-containing protein n=1 Tax=Hordeum vulgare subsp. vulgare TaxID=112509 RepID=A0A8I6XUX8_HORVV|nr:protein HAPLESS 2 [Hordeum vulgare subsp. vulgare]
MAPRPPRPPSRPAHHAVFLLLAAAALVGPAVGVEILSKSRLERCALDSGAGGALACDRKVVLNLAVPSGSSGGESSLVAQVVEVEEDDTQAMQTVRDPPVITINKSATYALYDISYIRDVAYKPEELFTRTHKCESDAGANVVGACERLRDQNGHVIEHTEPVCCPCGNNRRISSSCGSIFDKMVKGKANTAHCVRFPGDWFHVFGIGKWSRGFSIRVQVKKGSSVTEVIVSPQNKTVVSKDNFLRVNLIGDFDGYTSIPSFEDFYLVTPRKGGGDGQPQVLGDEFSRWMLLERVRFTLDGLECNKIGVGYEAYRNQPNLCGAPLCSCLYNQLWNFKESDDNRVNRNQEPQYIVQGRFDRINQHPDAGVHTFSIGITEELNTNLLIEVSADDINYVYQRSPGKILSINVPTFEALSQVGTAKVTIKNIGKLEASYSLTFDCLSGITYVEEQFFIMKPDQVLVRSFYLRSSSDQASKYRCSAILKASDFSELDRAQCQFSTTATVLDNGTQIGPPNQHKKGGIRGFIEAIETLWRNTWDSVIDFFTGRSCSTKCSSFLDLSCHIQYICIGWLVMFGLLLATLPAVAVLLWLLHQKGLFDPLYDCWEDVFGPPEAAHGKHGGGRGHHAHTHAHHHQHHHHSKHPTAYAHKKRSSGAAGQQHHHHHHHVPHKHGGQPDGGERHRHAAALGVQHRDAGHKHHRHGKAAQRERERAQDRDREHRHHHSRAA